MWHSPVRAERANTQLKPGGRERRLSTADQCGSRGKKKKRFIWQRLTFGAHQQTGFFTLKETSTDFCFCTRCDDRVQSHKDRNWMDGVEKERWSRNHIRTANKHLPFSSLFPPVLVTFTSDCHQAVKRYEVMFPTLSLDLISSEAHKSYQVFLEI